jgi:hypothetical protein
MRAPKMPARMRAGIAQFAGGAGVVMNKRSQIKFGFKAKDFLCIVSEEHDTRICRQLYDLPPKTPSTTDYLYLDADSLNLLNVDLHGNLSVSKSDIDLDMP